MGAVGIYTASQKIRTGLQHLMAGSRNFNLSTIMRRDLMILPEECEKVTVTLTCPPTGLIQPTTAAL